MNTRLLYLLLFIANTFLCNSQNFSELVRNAEFYNDASSQNQLGAKFETGDGVTADINSAIKWYQKAADNNFASAQYNLARVYEYGLSGIVDYNKALYYYQKAADNNHTKANLRLGYWYKNGNMVPQDNRLSYKYFKNAAFTGSSEAKYELAYDHAFGCGTDQDSIKSFFWIRRALADEYTNAYYLAGHLYEHGIAVNKNDYLAYAEYKSGDDDDNDWCSWGVGHCYLEGIYVERDTLEAIEYLGKSANRGYILSQRTLAYVYYQRNELNNAAYWFEKIVSTKSSNSSDYESLLDIYTKLNKLNECYLLASKGSELGYTDCINVLAYCYAFGNGTKQNFKLAIKTIDKAIQLAPDNMNYLDSKGEILLMNKKTNDARKIWEQINQTVHGYYADKTTVLNDYFMNSSN